jgi:hypothetical protein
MERHYKTERDRRLGLAVLGFHDAIRNEWGAAEVDFDSKRTQVRFGELDALSDDEIFRLTRMPSLVSSPLLPHSIRFELMSLRKREGRTARRCLDTIVRIALNRYRRDCAAISRIGL